MPDNDETFKLKEILEFRAILSSESDKECALSSHAYLKAQLGELLAAYFINETAFVTELLEDDRPLGPFPVRIDVAFALGLISKNARHDLLSIHRISNEFRYSPYDERFDSPKIKGYCDGLFHVPSQQEMPRRLFTRAVIGVLGLLHARLLKTHHLPAPDEVEPIAGSVERVYRMESEIRAMLEGRDD